jgi:deoxyribodipyrimidine photo-lyase
VSRSLLWWVRRDLRLADNPALHAAARAGAPLLAVYVLDDETPGRWVAGGASRWWLHGSLAALADELAALGVPLVLRRGRSAGVIAGLARETRASVVLASRVYEPWALAEEQSLRERLPEGVALKLAAGALLFDPQSLRNQGGRPFQVFTPFWKACLAATPPGPPRPVPDDLAGFHGDPGSEALSSWNLLPQSPDWAAGLREAWTPGEAGGWARWEAFADEGLTGYAAGRDRPDLPGTSRLSPHLHFGEISPRALWHAAAGRVDDERTPAGAVQAYLRELGWREFSAHLLYHWPDLPEQPLRAQFRDFPWASDAAGLRAWQQGCTGYPIVDAGLRELWRTGWMHNRVRMIVASFLVKDLLLPWQEGAAWFHDTLVDADLASNAASWQWVAGCGADAAPYFRIFNPVLQGKKFDPEGDYVRRWVPELARLPLRHLHEPWSAPAAVLAEAGVRLGSDYPGPLVDHAKARDRALKAFAAIR